MLPLCWFTCIIIKEPRCGSFVHSAVPEVFAAMQGSECCYWKAFFTSRWKCILPEYNSARARLLNSQALLEGTKMRNPQDPSTDPPKDTHVLTTIIIRQILNVNKTTSTRLDFSMCR